MDLSDEYRQMCKQSPEIQNMCKHEFGDFTWIESLKTIALTNYPNLNDPDRLEYVKTNCVWLPRQDQLQEILNNEYGYNIPIVLTESFYEWLDLKYSNDHGYGIVFDTLEKSWLAFFMDMVHDKQWNGKEWVRT